MRKPLPLPMVQIQQKDIHVIKYLINLIMGRVTDVIRHCCNIVSRPLLLYRRLNFIIPENGHEFRFPLGKGRKKKQTNKWTTARQRFTLTHLPTQHTHLTIYTFFFGFFFRFTFFWVSHWKCLKLGG